MTEQKQIPRMVEARDYDSIEWMRCELLADLSEFGISYPFVCRNPHNPKDVNRWKYIREIPQPKTRPMTPRELLDAIRGGAVWRYEGCSTVYNHWNNCMAIKHVLLCHDWHGTDSDIWVKAEVTE